VHVLVLSTLVLFGILVRRRGWRLALLGVGALVIAHPAVAARAPASAWDRPVGEGARLWQRGGATIVVVHDARPDQLLRAVRGAGVRRIDVLVLAGSGRRAADAVRTLVARVPSRAVVATPGSPLGSATFGRIDVPPLAVDVHPGQRGLEAAVTRR
jgi:hypothetical protein